MNKKVLLILVLVFSLFSVVLIAVWGTLPENPTHIELEDLVIDDFDETNDDGDKFKNITDIVTPEAHIFTIVYRITPENASTEITASTTSSGVNLQVDNDLKRIYVIFALETIAKKKTVTIQIKDKVSQISDEITLWFKTPDTIIIPEI